MTIVKETADDLRKQGFHIFVVAFGPCRSPFCRVGTKKVYFRRTRNEWFTTIISFSTFGSLNIISTVTSTVTTIAATIHFTIQNMLWQYM